MDLMVYRKGLALPTAVILILSILAVVSSIPVVNAQVPRIELSATTISDETVLEVTVYTDPAWPYDNVTLRVLDSTLAPYTLVDDNGTTIDYTAKKFVATKLVAGVYKAYLGGNETNPADPVEYPKVTVDGDVDDAVAMANSARFPDGDNTGDYYLECLEAGVRTAFKYKFVTLSVETDRSEYPPNAYMRLWITDQDYNKDPTSTDTLTAGTLKVKRAIVTRTSTGETFDTGTIDPPKVIDVYQAGTYGEAEWGWNNTYFYSGAYSMRLTVQSPTNVGTPDARANVTVPVKVRFGDINGDDPGQVNFRGYVVGGGTGLGAQLIMVLRCRTPDGITYRLLGAGTSVYDPNNPGYRSDPEANIGTWKQYRNVYMTSGDPASGIAWQIDTAIRNVAQWTTQNYTDYLDAGFENDIIVGVEVYMLNTYTAATILVDDITLGNVTYDLEPLLTNAGETEINSAKFLVSEVNVDDPNDFLGFAEFLNKTLGLNMGTEFKSGDVVELQILKSVAEDPDTPGYATVKFTVKSISPTITIEKASFSEEIRVTFDSPNDNLKSWDKETIGSGEYKATLLVDGQEIPLTTVDLKETGVDTAKFTGEIDLEWNSDLLNYASEGKTFKLKVNTTGVEAYTTIPLTAPTISLDKTSYYPFETMKITVEDPELNDDATRIESYVGSVSGGDEIKDASLTKPGTSNVFLNVTLTNLRTGTAVKVKSGETVDLILVETEENSGVFTMSLNLTKLDDVKGGDTLRLKIFDYTSGTTVTQDIPIETPVKTLSLDRTIYPVPRGKNLNIRITFEAPDLNRDPNAIESVEVNCTISYYNGTAVSGYDPKTVELRETDVNSGVFKGKVPFTTDSSAMIGGKVKVEYEKTSAKATFTVTTASISAEPAEVTFGDTIKVKITDKDLDLDSLTKDTINAKLTWTTLTGDTDETNIELTETDVNTGEFEATIDVGGYIDTKTFKPKPATTITVEYEDTTSVLSTTAGFAEETLKTTVKMKSYTGVLTLDKTEYGPGAEMTITVTDYDLNYNVTAKDTVDEDVVISIEGIGSESLENMGLSLEETGVSTGIYTGTFKIVDELAKGIKPDIKLKDVIGKRITIVYKDSADETGVSKSVTALTKVISVDPKVTFNKVYYEIDELATITIVDLDANLNPTVVNTVDVHIYSDSDPVGVTVKASETDVNTGEFTATVRIASTFGPGMVYSKVGDTITAKYIDAYPADYATTGKSKTFTATAKVGAPPPKLPIVASTPVLTDPTTGALIEKGSVGVMVSLTTEMKNNATVDQPMLYIVQVKDEVGRVVYLSFVSGTVPALKTYKFGIGWTPEKAGTYTIEVYAWKSWTEPVPLSEAATTTVIVE